MADAAVEGDGPVLCLPLLHAGVEGSCAQVLAVDDPHHAAPTSPGCSCDKEERRVVRTGGSRHREHPSLKGMNRSSEKANNVPKGIWQGEGEGGPYV